MQRMLTFFEDAHHQISTWGDRVLCCHSQRPSSRRSNIARAPMPMMQRASSTHFKPGPDRVPQNIWGQETGAGVERREVSSPNHQVPSERRVSSNDGSAERRVPSTGESRVSSNERNERRVPSSEKLGRVPSSDKRKSRSKKYVPESSSEEEEEKEPIPFTTIPKATHVRLLRQASISRLQKIAAVEGKNSFKSMSMDAADSFPSQVMRTGSAQPSTPISSQPRTLVRSNSYKP